MTILFILDFLAEVFHLVFQIGILTRKYLVPAGVYLYVGIERYIVPAFMIPYYYLKMRNHRLSLSTVG